MSSYYITVKQVAIVILISSIFYVCLLALVRYLFRKIEDCVYTQAQERERYFKHDSLIASILYLFCTILFFYPCLKNISSSLIGPPEDNMVFLWNIWWIQKVIREHKIVLSFTNYIFYPQGTSLFFHDYSFYNIFLSLILGQFFNLVAVYNLLILHSFLLSGIGAFLLIKYLTKNSYISLLGGFIFAFNPYQALHAQNDLNITSIQFIPFFVLFFMKTVKGNSKKDLFLACLFFFLNGICSWYYLVFAIYFIGFSYVYLMWRRKNIFLKDIILKSAVIIGITLLILFPWWTKMAWEILRYSPVYKREGYDLLVADAFGLFVPHPCNWLLAQLKIPAHININCRFTGNEWEKTVYLGIIPITVILITFKKTITQTAKYFLGFFAFLIMAMGTSLHILGWASPVILPYTIIKYLPFFSHARMPSRIIAFVYLFFAIIMTVSLKYLINSYKSSFKRKLFIVVFVFLVFLDYYSVCTSMTKVFLPSCYNVIENKGESFALLDLPVEPFPTRYMMYQTLHGFPIVEGYIEQRYNFSLVDSLELQDLAKQAKQLKENHVKFIIMHNNTAIAQQYENQYKTIYKDEENAVFQVY